MNSQRGLLVLIACLIILQVSIHLSWLARGLSFVVSRITLDDTYYYVQTAWNMRTYGFPTFDGINSTNGVQFLWFWLLVVVAYVAPDKYTLLFLTLILCALLNLSGYFAVWKLRGKIPPLTGVVMVTSWFYLVARFPYYMNGMENSLHASLFWLLLLGIIDLIDEVQDEERSNRRFAFITLISVLIVWTRLDSVIYVAPLYIYAGWYWLRNSNYSVRRNVPLIAALLSSVVLSSGLMLFVYYRMGGSVVPVSGLVKSDQMMINLDFTKWLAKSIIRGWRLTFPLELWRLFVQQPDNFFPPISGTNLVAPLAVIVIGLTSLWMWRFGGSALCQALNNNPGGLPRRFCGLGYLLLATNILYVLYYSSGGNHSTYAVWYLSPFFIFCIIAGALTIETMLRKTPRSLQGLLRCLTATMILVASLAMTAATNYYLVGTPYESGGSYTRITVADWMRRHTEIGTVFAAWNAGGLAFLSDRQVINLDGLINNAEYYYGVLTARKKSTELYEQRLLDYLDSKGVDYVVDNRDFIPDALRDSYILVKTFLIVGERGVIEIYRNPNER